MIGPKDAGRSSQQKAPPRAGLSFKTRLPLVRHLAENIPCVVGASGPTSRGGCWCKNSARKSGRS